MLVQSRGLNIQFADVFGLGVEIGVVAVEPVNAAVGLEVSLCEDSANGGPAHGFVGVTVDEFESQIVQAPLTGDTVMLGCGAAGQVDDFELFVGGKSSEVGRSEERLEGQAGRVGDSEYAKELPRCDRSRIRWRPAGWKHCLAGPGAR